MKQSLQRPLGYIAGIILYAFVSRIVLADMDAGLLRFITAISISLAIITIIVLAVRIVKKRVNLNLKNKKPQQLR